MGDRSQDQEMKAMGGDGQQTQAGGDAFAVQNSPGAQIIRQSYWSLFGDRPVSPGIDWDWAQRIVLEPLKEEIDERLDKSLLGFIPVDGLNVKVSSQEDSPFLELGLLEPQKTVSVDGTIDDIDSRMPIIQTYAKTGIGKKLLILGTPGAGKTITLLKLAKQLVGEAINNPKTVIPVVFELSTWRDGQSIEAWLIEQLYENYDGNRKRKIYEMWVERRVLLPLLDGLDELGMVRQKACTEKVNEFAKTYPQVVVCCRVKEFQQAGVNLSNLRGKVQLQPLSDRQIERYLAQMGKSGLWEQIKSVPEMGRLLEPVIDKENADYDEPGLLRVPLFISLAARVYERDQPFKGKTELLDLYIDRQLSWDVRVGDRTRKDFKGRSWAYKSINDEPTDCQARKYVQWLSQKIVAAEITEFKLEWIRYGITSNKDSPDNPQPRKISWLDTKKQLFMHRFLYRSLIISLLVIANSIYSNFLFDSFAMISLSIISLISMLLSGYCIGFLIDLFSKFSSKKSAYQNLVEITKFIFVTPVKWIYRISYSNYLLSFLAFVLIFSVCLTLFTSILIHLSLPFFGNMRIFLSIFIKEHPLLAITLIGNGAIHLPMGLFLGLLASQTLEEKSAPKQITKKREERNSTNQEKRGLWGVFSVESTILGFVFYNQSIYTFGWLICVGPPAHIELPSTVLFPGFPVFFSILFLGLPEIFFRIDASVQIQFWQHLPRRLILHLTGKMPWNLAQFLTYCHDRRLLQQIGGRYRFIHRELLEHFARMEN